jgi:hypothetical protein
MVIDEFRDPAAALDIDDSGAGVPRAYRVKVTVTSEQGGALRSLALETIRLRPGASL